MTALRAGTVDVARGGTLAFGGALVAAVLGLALVLVVSRGAGAAGAGLFFQAIAAFTILTGLVTFGADTALLRALSRQRALGIRGDGRRVLAIAALPVLVAGSTLALAALWQADRLAGLFPINEQADVASYVRALAPVLVLASLSLLAAQGLRGLGCLAPYVVLQSVLVPAVRLVAVTVVVALGLGSAPLALAWGLPIVLAGLACVVLLLRGLSVLERGADLGAAEAPRAVLARQFWAFSLPRGLASVLDLALTWSDVLIVGAVLGARAAGVYAAASRLAAAGTLALQAVRLATAPRYSAMFATGGQQDAGALYRSSTVWVVLSSWPIYLVLALFAPTVMQVFGDEFVAGAHVLMILALGMLVHVGTGGVQTVLLMAGRSSWVLGNKSAAVAVNIGLNLLLVPRLGIEGAALGRAAAVAVDNLSALVQVRRGLGLVVTGRGLLISGLAAVTAFGLAGLGVRLVTGTGVGALAAALVLGAAAYALLLHRYREVLELPGLRDLLSTRRPDGRAAAPVPMPSTSAGGGTR